MASGGGDDLQRGTSPVKKGFLFRRRKKIAPPPIAPISTSTSTTHTITTTIASTSFTTPTSSLPTFTTPISSPTAVFTPPAPTPSIYASPHAQTTQFPSYTNYPQPPLPPNPGGHPFYYPGYMQPGYYPPPPPYGSHYTYPEPSTSQIPTNIPSQPVEEPMPQAEQRQYIEPDGDTFYPSREPIHKIRDIIKGKFDAPYTSWKKIPPSVREMWFKEFEKSFYWLPQHHDKIRRNFNSRGSTRLRDMFTDIRLAGQRPPWIGEAVWAGLCAEWRSPEYMQKREQNKKNRASDSGGMGSSLQTGGSIPHTEHRRRLKNILGREPTPVELHQRTHQRKADHQWVDTRAQKVHEDYTRIAEAHRHSSAGESSSGTSQRSEYDLWLEAVGGQKKGRIYGLGSQGVAYGSSSSSSPYPGHAQDHLEEMMRRQFASYADEMRSRMSAEIDARVDAAIKARLGKNIVEEEAEEEEEEDDDDV